MEAHGITPTLDSPPPKPTLDHLRYVVNKYPLIDNHAHNLLLPSHIDTVPFESITSEAQGRALRDTFKSLPHLRAARQLRDLYKCAEDATWEEVQEQRLQCLRSNPDQLYEDCFAGTHALLIDDGLAGRDTVYEYTWHDRWTKAPSKRIVRIETLAERLMESLMQEATESDLDDPEYFAETWLAFTEDFEREIQHAIRDDEVAGFKTVICYRTGLDIEPDYVRAAKAVGIPFERYVARCIRKRSFRLQRKALNDYLVLRTLEILSERLPEPGGFCKPLQFHTGLGDNDISLREANPAYLQPLIESYPHVPFVLLHSAYPYTRQAGYLATVYKHVYLDIGEVFPMVSKDGQKAILRQSLELVPGSKLLYSTDGHWFPETYWLANKQFREVWLELLTEYVQQGELTPHQGINLTKDLLFNNSNFLYRLGYQADFKEMEEPPKTLAWRSQVESPIQPTPLHTRPTFLDPGVGKQESPTFPPPPKKPQVYDVELFEDFIKANPTTKFIYVQWLDYMATIRARILPIKEFERMIRAGDRISISQGNTGTLQNDTSTPVMNPVGQIYIEPDLRSLRRTHQRDPLPSATVLSFWRDEQGRPMRSCPRYNLEVLLNDLKFNHGVELVCGFEIEVTFLKREDSVPKPSKGKNPASPSQSLSDGVSGDDNEDHDPYTPLTGTTHAWGTFTPSDFLSLPLLAEIADALSHTSIEVQQFHSESGPAQFEFVLSPLPALAAIDALIQARQFICQIAALHDVRATFHPQVWPGEAGTAAHVHVSGVNGDKEMPFWVQGVLGHLPALCAFSMPEAESYARVRDDSWTGGTWVAWGTQNRETPLRKVHEGRWEVRCVDGFANAYFVVAGLVAAGILGLTGRVEEESKGMSEERRQDTGVGVGILPPPPLLSPLQDPGLQGEDGSQAQAPAAPSLQAPLSPFPPPSAPESSPPYPIDTPYPPSTLTSSQRLSYGITRRLPFSISQALAALESDGSLREMMDEVVQPYLAMKRAEQGMLGAMGKGERRVWLVERY
ncbi:glutamine synthetase/guanido kinase [Westerdykella ornata]|uniref:Glutamine synthetase/guanido kinase n=1 Tax=Westerdykella ornata TaxID=318751 RepID=A0A6A6J8G1_WESOR|nr:glutamine synthetase/guanido kinase [Westerdykella ornata]KAF2272443.1 glutamine synthetase/guanido kinase [Westerdykella ornata]